MSHRLDVFTRTDDTWTLYVEAVTPTNARRIATALEREGEHVELFTHAKVIGKIVYQSPRQSP